MKESLQLLDGPFDAEDSFTLAILRNSGAIILGQKTRGFGAGKLVLPGGKDHLYVGNSGIALVPHIDNITREVNEEIGLMINHTAFTRIADLHVSTEDDGKDISVFQANCSCAEINSTDELQNAQWYSENDLPYEEMPEDYSLWLPHVLAGYAVTAYIVTDRESIVDARIFRHKLEPLGRMEMLEFEPAS